MRPTPDRIARLMLVGHREGGMVSLEEAARILGVAPAAVPRVVDRLASGELGVPPFLCEDVATLTVNGGWIEVVVPAELGVGWPFHAADAACMGAALRAVRAGLPPDLQDRCDDLIARLGAAIDPELRDEADLRGRALAWAVSEAVDPAIVSPLAEAAEQRERVRLTVYNASRDAVQDRDVLALLVLQHGQGWYLCGRDPDDGALRWWRVDRVLAVARTGERHDAAPPRSEQIRRPVLFDAPAHPLHVEVAFDDEVAARAVRWFADADARRLEDGRVVRTIATPTVPVLLRRLFRFGDGWEILGPDGARDALSAWCDAMCADG